jgi:AraC-like DNA-binding protein
MIPYEKIETENRADNEKGRIMQYFAGVYNDPELTLAKTASDLGIHYTRIGGIMKRYFKLSFKQYLNMVRIAETRRLLSSTDLPITEIALKVGFNNVTHFNRIFKIIAGVTPKEYRKRFYNMQ